MKLPSEKEIQDFIWAKREEFHELIEDIEFPEEIKFDNEDSVYQLKPEQIIFNNLLRNLKEMYSTVQGLILYGVEVPLTKDGESTIRADFLGMEEGAPGIAIIELKRSGHTEREAFTELLAYSNHLNTIFPTHCNDDTILILIAPMESRTLKEAFLQTLIFDRKRIFVLQPRVDNNDISTLKLIPFIPNIKDVHNLACVAFDKKNFDVQVIVWEDIPEFWNPSKEKGETEPDAFQKEAMNTVASYAAQLMEAKGIHGFVYSSQLWPELATVLPFTNSLILVGLNPYKVANSQFFAKNHPEIASEEIPIIENEILSLVDFLPGLNRNAKKIHEDDNYLVWQNAMWISHLTKIGLHVVETSTLNLNYGEVSVDAGTMDFKQFETKFFESVSCFRYNVFPTGIINELYKETTKIDYAYEKKFKSNPFHGDMYNWAIETLVSHYFFSRFLDRMFWDQED